MTVGQQGPGSDGRVSSEDDGAPTERVRASSETPRTAALGEVDDRANITAELPPVAPRRQSASEFRSAPAAPRRERREPAPTAFRIVVWSLFFVFLFALAGLVTVTLHPDWLSFLRNDAHVSPPITVPPAATVHHNNPTTMSLISSSPTTVAYSVPAASFSIVVRTAAGGNGCWTVVHSPLTTGKLIFAETIPRNTVKTIALAGSGSVVLDASSRSLSVVSGSTTLGTVTAPKLGVTYEFTSTSG